MQQSTWICSKPGYGPPTREDSEKDSKHIPGYDTRFEDLQEYRETACCQEHSLDLVRDIPHTYDAVLGGIQLRTLGTLFLPHYELVLMRHPCYDPVVQVG